MTVTDAEPRQDHNRLTAALADVEDRYRAAHPLSFTRWKDAHAVMPGGNTRTVLHFDPFPLTVSKGEGTYLYDLEGHRRTDFLGEYSAGLFGHSHPVILAAIREALQAGLSLGAPNRWEAKLAEAICARFPSIELVRFTNSGTEANLMALGAARAFTGRDRIMVMDGGYHGGVLYYAHGGTPVNAPFDAVFARYNDVAHTEALLEAEGGRLAAILLEPMMGSSGCIPADPAFLAMLREQATRHGAVLIFDEVMTSRSGAGGLHARLGVTPDMTTLGKYLGGGCSFGAFGGRGEIMQMFDPAASNALPHAGTFNNNVMSMAAGCAALTEVFTAEAAEALFDRGEGLKTRLNEMARAMGAGVQVTGAGSIMALHPTLAPIRSPHDADHVRPELRRLLHLEMLMRGYVFAQRSYMSLNIAMSEADIDGFAAAFEDVLTTHPELFRP
jgi:glutamate-1-semialdehyde 2,1-aminomutase